MANETSINETDRAKAVLDEQRFVTGRLSETCRYICFGLLALFYSIRDSDKGFSKELLNGFSGCLNLVALFAALAIIADCAQYVMGGIAVKEALKNKNRYNDGWLSYKARTWFYEAKQYLTLSAAVLFVYTVAIGLSG